MSSYILLRENKIILSVMSLNVFIFGSMRKVIYKNKPFYISQKNTINKDCIWPT